MENKAAVSFRHITKAFGSKVVANKDVSMDIMRGEILALLGENGSGKTTLMNMLSGIYHQDSGQILVDGEEVHINSPKDAYALGIGMIHQHFKLVDVFTATENVALGMDKKQTGGAKEIAKAITEICDRYGFDVDPKKKVYNMTVSQKQTLEIVKALYRGANILILDEPTAVLTPQETDKLFAVLRNMKADGKSIIIITHKLNEVLAISDRVSILRKGEYIDTVKTAEATVQSLTDMMVGQKVELDIERPEIEDKQLRLSISHLTCLDKYGVTALDDVSFDAYGGEILGIAGISGSGQKQLLESIAGLQKAESGSSIEYIKPESGARDQLIGKSVSEIKKMGVALSFVPEDRLGMGLVGTMGMSDNMMLRSYEKGHGMFTDRKTPRNLAEKVKEELEVVTPGISTPVRKLSGGNVQKVLVGREIASNPTVLMAAYAVRGLDINTSYTIYHLLNEQKKKGVAVIYVGEDLDVLLALCDRIAVLCGGKLNGIVDGRTATKEEVGLLMTNLKEDGQEGQKNDND
ncbi:ABC transporter ATP-binding protein [Ruminococcus sp.]|uniref:ABC transporter ATP-binding protein n=1 Tax=Ruminococcus sp. TaxID=41978 RepID=UPI003866E66E